MYYFRRKIKGKAKRKGARRGKEGTKRERGRGI